MGEERGRWGGGGTRRAREQGGGGAQENKGEEGVGVQGKDEVYAILLSEFQACWYDSFLIGILPDTKV